MGIVVTDSIITSAPSDVYATHDADLGRGGYRSVNTHEEMLAIPNERRTEGMVCHVNALNRDYRLRGPDWVPIGGIGPPVPALNMLLTDQLLFMRDGVLMSITLERFKCAISSLDGGGAVISCAGGEEPPLMPVLDSGTNEDPQDTIYDGGDAGQVYTQIADGGDAGTLGNMLDGGDSGSEPTNTIDGGGSDAEPLDTIDGGLVN